MSVQTVLVRVGELCANLNTIGTASLQTRTFGLTLQDGELLAQREILEGDFAAITEDISHKQQGHS